MPNMKPEKTPMPAQNPIVRSGNFEEVEYGYTHEMRWKKRKDACSVNMHLV